MAEAKTKIGTAEFTLTWTEDIAVMERNHRTRALKLIDAFRAAGENGTPKERKTRTRTRTPATMTSNDPQAMLESQ